MKRIVVLISGRGSNLRSLWAARLAGNLPAEIVAVISNRPDAEGLVFAAQAGIPVRMVDHRRYAGRAEFDAALAQVIDEFMPDLVVLAGFMRILTDDFVRRYSGRMLNVHPSLLPAFPGLNTHQRALEEGVRIHGCTVHFVTPTLDHGPIVAQAAVPVLDGDDPATLAARVLAEEHRVYPAAIRWFVEGRLHLDGQRVRCDVAMPATDTLISPREP